MPEPLRQKSAQSQHQGKRSKGRSLALQVLYALDCANEHANSDSAVRMLAACVENFGDDISVAGKDFAEDLVKNAVASLKEVDDELGSTSENWRLSRMSRIDRNILRLAAYELRCEENTPAPVVLNEAIELAKVFGAEGSPAFVNGILDHVASNHPRVETSLESPAVAPQAK